MLPLGKSLLVMVILPRMAEILPLLVKNNDSIMESLFLTFYNATFFNLK